MAKKQFKAESKRLLDLMIHSIYKNREIFLRELISNASDAMDKLCYLSLTNDKVSIDREKLCISIKPDKENKTLTISDNGIGMDSKALEDNLGIIAKSGSLQFKKDMAAENDLSTSDIDIIGQFGVGFYSAFMVSDKVKVISRAYGAEQAFAWESDGSDGYTITECEKDEVGTDIIMTIKADSDDEKFSQFLEQYTIKHLVKKYSDYVRYPIKMDMEKSRPIEKPEDEKSKDETDEKSDENKAPEYETYIETETLNDMVPIWHKSKNDVTDEQYNQFYKDKFMDYQDPAMHIKLETEGVISYEALLFIPSKTPYDYFTKEYEKGLQLYSSGVLIMDNCSDLLPEHFRFVKGVVDSQDLSLNISRETIQQNRQLQVIASSIEKKIKRELSKMLENEREKYEGFYKNFGIQLKYGIASEYGANKDALNDLLLFYSSTEKKLVTLAEYVSRMKEEQKNIYYACGETIAKIDRLPQTDSWKDKGYEILYLTDEVDDFVMKTLHEIDGKEIKSISNSNEDTASKEETEQAKEQTEQNQDLLTFVKESLNGKVKEVKITNKLKNHPVCLSSDGSISLEMEKYFAKVNQSHGQNEEEVKAERILELNCEHKIFESLKNAFENDKDKAKRLSEMLYNQAMLIAGFSLDDPTAYTDLLCELFS